MDAATIVNLSVIADTPEPPYYAVIFTSVRTEGDKGYSEMSDKMEELAKQQDGFLGIESARETVGITVSYWRDQDSIQKWKENIEHTFAREKGREVWYKAFKSRIALVQKDYSFSKDGSD
jgi:heme-degrading monooxygenase HmoA